MPTEQAADEHAAEERTADGQAADKIRRWGNKVHCKGCGDDITDKRCGNGGGRLNGFDRRDNGGSGKDTTPTDLTKRRMTVAGFSTEWGKTGGSDSTGSSTGC